MASREAPVKGWNARDPEATMSVGYALELTNWFPQTGDVAIRPGSIDWSTGLGTAVGALMPYASTTLSKLFAATATGIYDVTTQGAVGAAVMACTNKEWQSVNMNSLGGSYLLAVNGIDTLKLYDGATWKSITNVSVPAITGLGTDGFDNIHVHKRRLFLVQKNSMSVWYLPVNQISGAASEFPLGQLFKLGGKLVAMATWSIDGGEGIDDMAVFITSEGEVAVYKGSDPGNAANWAQVGVYFIGPPLGKRCFSKLGGDLIVLTRSGVYPLSKALQSTTISSQSAVTDKIHTAFSDAVAMYSQNKGWEASILPAANLLLVNIPTAENVTAEQYGMNTITGAWFRVTNWNAMCLAVSGNALYYGGIGKVVKAWTGVSDAGVAIPALARTAYDYYGDAGNRKQIKLVRPLLRMTGEAAVWTGFSTDFSTDAAVLNSSSYAANSNAVFDTALYDTATWAADAIVRRDWQGVLAPAAYAYSFNLKVETSTDRVTWALTDYLYERGSPL